MTLIDNVGSYGVSKYGCAVRFSHELIKEAELKRGLVKLHLMAIIDTLLAEDSIFDVGSRDLIFKIKAETRSPAEHEYENEPPYLSMSMEDREELWEFVRNLDKTRFLDNVTGVSPGFYSSGDNDEQG